MKNIPNALTTVRFFLVPAFAAVYFGGHENSAIFSALIFLLAGMTDVLDGFIARKYHLITDWGKLMDPLADKLMQVTVLVCLCISGVIHFWVVLLVLLKELFMIAGSFTVFKRYSHVVSANRYGKISTLVLFGVLMLILLFEDLPRQLSFFLLAIAIFFSLFALIRYFQIFLKIHDTNKNT